MIRDSKLPVLFFGLEMSKEQIMCNNYQLKQILIKTKKSGKLYQDDWKLNKIIKLCRRFHFLLMIRLIYLYSRYSIKKSNFFEQTKLVLVFIDYLQLMQNTKSKTESRVQELSILLEL
jgi:replicative DNA helicase